MQSAENFNYKKQVSLECVLPGRLDIWMMEHMAGWLAAKRVDEPILWERQPRASEQSGASRGTASLRPRILVHL